MAGLILVKVLRQTTSCPKCKAKIGVLIQQIATETGNVFGALCYICGYWQQEYPKP
jgi:hypothetical protein